VLEAPGTSPHEYLVWTAFSSQLGMLDDHLAWWVEDGSGAVPVGTLTVGTYGDGTLFKALVIMSALPVGFNALIPINMYGLDKNLGNSNWIVTTVSLVVVVPVVYIILF